MMYSVLQNAQEKKSDTTTLGLILRNIGLVYSGLQKYDESIHYFGQALQYLPENASLLFRYGEVCHQKYLEESRVSSCLHVSNQPNASPCILFQDGVATFPPSES